MIRLKMKIIIFILYIYNQLMKIYLKEKYQIYYFYNVADLLDDF